MNKNEDAIIPDSLEQLREFMKNEGYLRWFGFEDNTNGENNFRLFDNIYTKCNGSTYASFHSSRVIRHFKGTPCRLFFHNSKKMLSKLKELKFDGIAHILFYRITPFGVFLLPSKDEAIFSDVILTIDGWLNDEELKCKIEINICTMCFTPFNS